MERALMALFGRERRAETYRRLAEAADVPLSPRATWLMYRVADSAPVTARVLAGQLGIPVADLDQRLSDLQAAGYLTPGLPPAASGPAESSPADGPNPADGPSPAAGAGVPAESGLALTAAGQQAATRLDAAREAGIDRLAREWQPDTVPELRRLLGRITRTLVATDPAPDPDEAAAQPAAG
jgi:hypothetical protein